MQRHSNPLKICSSALGRSLLEWYCMFEDFYCFTSIAPTILSKDWRRENCQIRQELARADYHRLPAEKRKQRLLDDLWPQLYWKVTGVSDVLGEIHTLKTVDTFKQSKTLLVLRTKLDLVRHDFEDFVDSPDVLEILQTSDAQYEVISKHSQCCPAPPRDFAPIHFTFPPAAHFRLIILCIQTYIRSVLYPLLHERPDDNDGRDDSYELCRTFAGLEYIFGDNQDDLLPAFSPLVTAGFTCPTDLRRWLWHKLAHFEDCGPFFEPIKKTLSIYWNMPNLVADGFGAWKDNPPENRSRILCPSDVTLASKIATMNLDESPDP